MSSEHKFNWMDKVSVFCVHHAAHCAPPALSERLTEEWLADLGERNSGMSRLRFALGCFWAISIIAREHRVAAVAAVTATDAQAGFTDYLQMGPSYSTRRTMTFFLVASLHAAVLGGLLLTVTGTYKKLAPTPFVTRVIDRERPPPTTPTLPTPNIERGPIDLPPMDKPPIDLTPPDTAIDPEISPLPPGPGIAQIPQDPPPHVVNRVSGRPGTHFPSTSDFYPDPAIRRGEHGTVAVNACVNAKGRLTSDPTILSSSGSAALDQAALRLARAGSGRYLPSTEEGRPVDSCYGFQVQFVLK